jgi:hypothetical protein
MKMMSMRGAGRVGVKSARRCGRDGKKRVRILPSPFIRFPGPHARFLIVLLAVLAAYLLGSVPFAVVCSRLFGLADPRSYGSKNPGATNVLRSGNKAGGALTCSATWPKGWLAVFLAQNLRAEVRVRARAGRAGRAGRLLWPPLPVFLASRAARAWPRPPACCWRSIRCSGWQRWHLAVDRLRLALLVAGGAGGGCGGAG